MAVHVVREGDSLSAIAEEVGTTLAEILSLNPQIANPDLIHPGQEVNIPEPAAAVVESAVEVAAEAPPSEPEPAAEPVAESVAEQVVEVAAAASAPFVAAVEQDTADIEGRPAV